jgi:hypothetical protein
MIYKDEELNVLDKKRVYLIDMINAHFKRVVDVNEKRVFSNARNKDYKRVFDDNLNRALGVFK